ncbi:MAG: hypothetical protein ABR497_07470 [Kiritimatiellia bacterium]|nr:hypothetical protein [Lentisphaerota bacterium]
MSAVSERIVGEFFFALGYMVRQPCKYQVGGRAKRPEEEASLLIWHPGIRELRMPANVLWTAADMQGINRAVVCIYGWHAERIYPATLENLPEIVRFAEPEAMRPALQQLGATRAATILCLPQLPASRELEASLLQKLRDKGVDGVLCFRTILRELIERVDSSRNYDKSDVLQILRILKIYDLLQSPQLELFTKRPAARRRKGVPAVGPT